MGKILCGNVQHKYGFHSREFFHKYRRRLESPLCKEVVLQTCHMDSVCPEKEDRVGKGLEGGKCGHNCESHRKEELHKGDHT